jgi:hypothetical protein
MVCHCILMPRGNGQRTGNCLKKKAVKPRHYKHMG